MASIDMSGWSNPFASPLFQQPMQQAQTPSLFSSFLQQPAQLDAGQQEKVKAHLDKMNLCNGAFSEVFHYMYTAAPETISAYQPTKHIQILQGSTKFEAKHEQTFIEKIKQYNSLPFAKFIIEYKKDIINSNIYSVTYQLQYSIK